MSRPAEEAFDAIVGHAAPAMVVVTTVVDGMRGGCLVGFHTQCSIEPRRYAFWLSKANRTYELGLRAELFALHFLAEGEHDLAELFGGTTGDDIDKFELTPWTSGPGDVPLLDGSANRVVLRRLSRFEAGEDHVAIIGEPIAAETRGSFSPLRLPDVTNVEPGHEAGEDRFAP